MKPENLPTLVGPSGHMGGLTVEQFAAPEADLEGHRPGLNVNDILFILFRHKWKIVLCALIGFAAAAGVYFLLPPVYESQAKLFVRYVVDRSAIDGLDSTGKPLISPTESVINSEVEILTSSDLATQVAEAIGINRLVPKASGEDGVNDAALVLAKGLEVTAVKGTSIIYVSYKSSDPTLPTQVLQELVTRYFDKHLQVHRSLGGINVATQETEQMRAQLNQTDEDLKQLKAKAGVISLAESMATLATELGKAQGELDAAQTDLAAQQARVGEVEKSISGIEAKEAKQQSDKGNQPQPVSGEAAREYQALITRVAHLRETETDLLSKYTSQNRLVKVKREQIDELEKQRRDLEKKNPGLLATVSAGGSTDGSRPPDVVSERARLAGLESQVATLGARVTALRERANLLAELGPKIEQLERKKEVQEANYKHSAASLEKARIDETLDSTRIPNISIVQAPSPPEPTKRNVQKVVLALAGGGLAIGIAIALLIEMVFDRTVKRPFEVETRLRIPLLLSIPHLQIENQRLSLPDSRHDGETVLAEDGRPEPDALDNGALLRPFCEAIRDRLGLFFELNNMAHKPKLVAVTGLSKNAGASTLAAGLAAALSEPGDGKVLLVDKPVAPKRFYDMMAQFKESSFDYVIFDMPSLGDTSSTLPMSGYMDKVLLVVEAEKSNGDAVKRAYSKLAAKVDVSVIFNKSRSYGLKWLDGEL
jgi:polysaccharide biosynthesis transport protein